MGSEGGSMGYLRERPLQNFPWGRLNRRRSRGLTRRVEWSRGLEETSDGGGVRER